MNGTEVGTRTMVVVDLSSLKMIRAPIASSTLGSAGSLDRSLTPVRVSEKDWLEIRCKGLVTTVSIGWIMYSFSSKYTPFKENGVFQKMWQGSDGSITHEVHLCHSMHLESFLEARWRLVYTSYEVDEVILLAGSRLMGWSMNRALLCIM